MLCFLINVSFSVKDALCSTIVVVLSFSAAVCHLMLWLSLNAAVLHMWPNIIFL